jgi:hypothetical protein
MFCQALTFLHEVLFGLLVMIFGCSSGSSSGDETNLTMIGATIKKPEHFLVVTLISLAPGHGMVKSQCLLSATIPDR